MFQITCSVEQSSQVKECFGYWLLVLLFQWMREIGDPSILVGGDVMWNNCTSWCLLAVDPRTMNRTKYLYHQSKDEAMDRMEVGEIDRQTDAKSKILTGKYVDIFGTFVLWISIHTLFDHVRSARGSRENAITVWLQRTTEKRLGICFCFCRVLLARF